ncbi:MAG: winged helix-turn-helix transcriptional regulator, partial [Nitrososphaerota archaeon]
MDEIDNKILEILKENPREKYVKIAKKIGLSEGTIRRRIKKMIENGIIKRFTIELSLENEGIVLVKTNPIKTKEIIEKIKKVSERIFEVSGDYDIAVLIQANTIDELNKKVDYIRGI